MEPNYAAMAEHMWPEFVRLMAYALVAPVALLVLLVVVAEAIRKGEIDAALRDLGITTRRPRAAEPPPAPPAEAEA
ncbi:MAG TPA: hypothetical protein VF613_02605, partial [Longimicrobium sp.]